MGTAAQGRRYKGVYLPTPLVLSAELTAKAIGVPFSTLVERALKKYLTEKMEPVPGGVVK